MENNSTLGKVLLVCNRNAELLQLVGATFDSKVAFFFKRMSKKYLITLKSLQFLFNLFGAFQSRRGLIGSVLAF